MFMRLVDFLQCDSPFQNVFMIKRERERERERITNDEGPFLIKLSFNIIIIEIIKERALDHNQIAVILVEFFQNDFLFTDFIF